MPKKKQPICCSGEIIDISLICCNKSNDYGNNIQSFKCDKNFDIVEIMVDGVWIKKPKDHTFSIRFMKDA